jgi:3,4-dihydroxy 2-butanone 4-phosphate synthase/GTP cyclohydrolase II
MARDNRSQFSTAFTVSIEAAEGVTTGISAADRARTVQAAVARHAKASDIVQPGHIFPIMAKPGGVLIRAGHTEAGCDLAGIAGLEPASVICEIMNDDGTMSRLPKLIEFATHGLKIGAIRDLIEYRARTEKLVEKVSEKTVDTPTAPSCRLQGQDLRRVHWPWSSMAHRRRDPGPRPRTRLGARLPRPPAGRHSFPVDTARASPNTATASWCCSTPQSGQDLLAQLCRRQRPTARPEVGPAPVRHRRPDPPPSSTVGQMKILANPRKIPSMAGFGLTVVGHVAPTPEPRRPSHQDIPCPATTTSPKSPQPRRQRPRVGVVMCRFNLDVCEGLLSSCTAELLRLGVAADITIATVPGALEAPSRCRSWPRAAASTRWWPSAR